jgi:Arc/MetJ-type ribon-helix-helix transcriptional regulator
VSCGDVVMPKASVSVSLPTRQLADLDELVEGGKFDDRSEAIQEAVGKLLEDNQ